MLVDNEDFSELSEHSWYLKTDGYASRIKSRKYGGARSTIRMHRVIMDCPKDMQVDHINGNRLDNRKQNLRICTHQQNRMNTGLRSDNHSGYKGVDVWQGKWRARIRDRTIGYFKSLEEAIEAYNAEAIKEYGDFARLNIIKGE